MINNFKSCIDVWKKFNFILSKKQKTISIVVFILTLIGAGFETLGVSVIVPLVQTMISANELLTTDFLQPLFSLLNISSSNDLIIWMCLAVVCVYVVKNAYLALLSFIRVRYSSSIMRELSVKMMKSYMKRGYSFFLNNNTSDLMRGISADVAGVYNVLCTFFKILAEVLTIVCICVYIFLTDAVMAVSIIIVAGICLVAILLLFKKRMRLYGERYREYSSLTSKHSLQAFAGAKEIIVMNRQKYFVNHYERAYEKQQKALIGQTVGSEIPAYIIEAVCVSGLIMVVGFRLLGGMDTEVFIPKLAAFAIAAFRILPSLGRISSNFNFFIYSCPSLSATYDNLKEVESYTDQENDENQETVITPKQFANELKLENVTWCYADTTENVLENLTLSIKKGQAVAFIGQSGTGKTTLADIILRILKPQQGKIMVDGIDINLIPEKWSKMIGYVPQSVYLTDDTIRNNIAFGIDEQDIDDVLIWESLEKSQLKDFVMKLPNGIDTIVGERGVRFSGGQRQRIAIARALYYDPDILVFDEATSALDNETEEAVMDAIDALHGQKTLIIIAHRLSTIKNCDVVYKIVNKIAVNCDKVTP